MKGLDNVCAEFSLTALVYLDGKWPADSDLRQRHFYNGY